MVQRWVEQCQSIAADISDGSDVDVDVMARGCGCTVALSNKQTHPHRLE
jgi:hypothetical protein